MACAHTGSWICFHNDVRGAVYVCEGCHHVLTDGIKKMPKQRLKNPTPRHAELINALEGLIRSGWRDTGCTIYNRGDFKEYRLSFKDADDLRRLVRAEAALQAMDGKEQEVISLHEYNNIVTTAMEVARAANWRPEGVPLKDGFMERVLTGAVVSYVMNRFNIKRS